MSVINYTKTNNLSQITVIILHLINNLLLPIRNWLNNIEMKNEKIAHRICQLIPAQCPFAREIKFGNITIIKIPPLCKINPFYNELMTLRFRAICYLADECGEDISSYC